VAIAASGVHLVFVVVAYAMLLQGRPENPLAFLWADVSAATVSCAAMAAAALPIELALRSTGAPVLAHLAIVGGVCAVVYLTALRLWFKEAWRDLSALLRRVLPVGRVSALARAKVAASEAR
jgi:hypothetical protein